MPFLEWYSGHTWHSPIQHSKIWLLSLSRKAFNTKIIGMCGNQSKRASRTFRHEKNQHACPERRRSKSRCFFVYIKKCRLKVLWTVLLLSAYFLFIYFVLLVTVSHYTWCSCSTRRPPHNVKAFSYIVRFSFMVIIYAVWDIYGSTWAFLRLYQFKDFIRLYFRCLWDRERTDFLLAQTLSDDRVGGLHQMKQPRDLNSFFGWNISSHFADTLITCHQQCLWRGVWNIVIGIMDTLLYGLFTVHTQKHTEMSLEERFLRKYTTRHALWRCADYETSRM